MKKRYLLLMLVFVIFLGIAYSRSQRADYRDTFFVIGIIALIAGVTAVYMLAQRNNIKSRLLSLNSDDELYVIVKETPWHMNFPLHSQALTGWLLKHLLKTPEHKLLKTIYERRQWIDARSDGYRCPWMRDAFNEAIVSLPEAKLIEAGIYYAATEVNDPDVDGQGLLCAFRSYKHSCRGQRLQGLFKDMCEELTRRYEGVKDITPDTITKWHKNLTFYINKA